jgi:hypothetical protein
MKLAQPYVAVDELVDRLEKLEKNLPFDEPENVPVRQIPPVAREEAKPYRAPAPAAPPEFGEEKPADPAPREASGGEMGAGLWDEVVSEFHKTRPIIGTVLSELVFEGVRGNSIQLSARNKFQVDSVTRNQVVIEDLIEKKSGKKYGLRVTIDENKQPQPKKEVIEVPEETAPASAGEFFTVEGDIESSARDTLPPGLDKIMNKFPGKITKKNNQ